MKYLFVVVFLLTATVFSAFTPQGRPSFEGIIIYRVSTQSKTPNISTEQLQKIYGTQMTVYIQGSNYRMSYDGLDLKEVFYLGAANRQYTLRKGVDTLFTTNCAEEKRRLVSLAAPAETSVIVGHKCQKLINRIGTVQDEYWFDPAIYVNPSNFKNHRFGYFDVYYSKAKAPYLKYLYNGTSFTLTYTAISIQEKALSSGVFRLPQFPKKEF